MAAAALWVAASINLTAGVVMAARDPSRAADLVTLYGWCRAWALDGSPLYPDPNGSADYPPNAIATLSPLALLSWQSYVVGSLLIALVATLALPYLVTRCTGRRDRSLLLWVTPLFLCWASVRTLLQFSTATMALMFAAVSLARKRPAASGGLLGLALAKPHFAAPIAVWMVLTRHVAVTVVAALVVLAGWILFDAHAHVDLWTMVASYWRVLVSVYSGNEGFIGRTSVRAWALSLAGGSRWGDPIWLVMALLLLIVPCRIAQIDSRRNESSLAGPSLFCVWSMLVFYHDSSHLIMLLPAFVFLLAVDDAATAWQRWSFAAFLQVFLMYDVPNRLGTLQSDHIWLTGLALNFDRLLAIATFVYVAVVWKRLNNVVPVAEHERMAHLG
jgi:hypothetical protein